MKKRTEEQEKSTEIYDKNKRNIQGRQEEEKFTQKEYNRNTKLRHEKGSN